jgi:hypothetical protein
MPKKKALPETCHRLRCRYLDLIFLTFLKEYATKSALSRCLSHI